MKSRIIATAFLLALAACGKDTTSPEPTPRAKGTVAFTLDVSNCARHAQDAQLFIDSVAVDSVPISQVGAKTYVVDEGRHSTVARLTTAGSLVGEWTYHTSVVVEPQGFAVSHLSC